MRKQSILISAAVSVLLAVGTLGCNSTAQSSDARTGTATAIGVRLGRAGIVRTLKVAGQFEPYQVIDVHAKVSGYIRHIYVDIGDRVHKGQVLAVLEVPELDAQLKGTVSQMALSKAEINRRENDVLRAQSQHAALHSNYLRLKQAAAGRPGLIAQQELDDASSKDMASEAEIDSAKAALAASKQESAVAGANNERVGDLADYARVTSPLDGVIVWRYADTGALIQAGTSSNVQTLPVVKLSQSSILRLRLPVPEEAVPFIHEGASVRVDVDALNRSFTGKIVRFTRNISLATRTMETEVDVENKDLSITPGMYAKTTLDLERRENVLAVPESALLENGNGHYVLVVNRKNQVESRDVQLGLHGPMLVEVRSGLSQGDFVITGGQSSLHVGETVQPKPQRIRLADQEQVEGGE